MALSVSDHLDIHDVVSVVNGLEEVLKDLLDRPSPELDLADKLHDQLEVLRRPIEERRSLVEDRIWIGCKVMYDVGTGIQHGRIKSIHDGHTVTVNDQIGDVVTVDRIPTEFIILPRHVP